MGRAHVRRQRGFRGIVSSLALSGLMGCVGPATKSAETEGATTGSGSTATKGTDDGNGDTTDPGGSTTCGDGSAAMLLRVEDEGGELLPLQADSVAVGFEGAEPTPVSSDSGSVENPVLILGEPGAYRVAAHVEGYGMSTAEVNVPASPDGCGAQTVMETLVLESDAGGDGDTRGGCGLILIPAVSLSVRDPRGETIPLVPGDVLVGVNDEPQTVYAPEHQGVLRQPLGIGTEPGTYEITVAAAGYEPATITETVGPTEDGCHADTVSTSLALQPMR